MILPLPSLHSEPVGSEDVGNRRQSIVGLGRWGVVDMGRMGEVRALVCNVPSQGMGLLSTGEALVERGRLDHPFIGELFM